MYNIVVLICTLAIGASLANMDWNLWGITALLPTVIAVNGAGALIVSWAWSSEDLHATATAERRLPLTKRAKDH